MAGLKQFRSIPNTLVEWSRWMRDQDLVSSDELSVAISTVSTVKEETLLGDLPDKERWKIADFASARTLRDEDEGYILRSTSGSGVNFTVDAGWINGEHGQVVVMQYGAGQVTIVAGTGVTIRTPTTLTINEQYGSITLIQIDNDEYLIAGRMTP